MEVANSVATNSSTVSGLSPQITPSLASKRSSLCCAQYTPPTRLNCRVESRRRRRSERTISSRDSVYNFLCYWAIEVVDKWRQNDVIVGKVFSIDQNSPSQTAMESVWSVSKLSTESVGSRRELVANSVHTVDADTTQLDSWVASRIGGVYWALWHYQCVVVVAGNVWHVVYVGDTTTTKLNAYSNDNTHATNMSTTSGDVVGVPASSRISAATSSRPINASTISADNW